MNTEELGHILRHDFRVEVKAILSFIEFIIQDIENKDTSKEDMTRNLNILKQTFKKLYEEMGEILNHNN